MDAAAFEVFYVEHFLAPSLGEGHLVVMDNTSGSAPAQEDPR